MPTIATAEESLGKGFATFIEVAVVPKTACCLLYELSDWGAERGADCEVELSRDPIKRLSLSLAIDINFCLPLQETWSVLERPEG